MQQGKSIKQNWVGAKEFNIRLCVICGCYGLGLISRGKTGRWALDPSDINIIQIASGFQGFEYLNGLTAHDVTHIRRLFY